MIFRYFIRNFSKKTNLHSVTTPIFYVNAAPHIGHLYSAVIADTINRYQNLKYPEKTLSFTTGTDEHGMKIQQAAELHKIPVNEYCKTISENYRDVFNLAYIKYTDFVTTSEERHIKAVQHFWNILKSKNCIYRNKYSGWYCVSDETFLTENQLKFDLKGQRVSIESGHPVEWTDEVNYMFPLNKFQHDIYYWIKGNNRIKPSKFEKILLNYMDETLPDISISRPISRVSWGVKVPDDPGHTVYVWLDALVNYLTCCGYPDKSYSKLWPPTLQIIGKDILKFHGIYWPAFLIAAGLEPPNSLFVHSHWTVDGEKMSKSKLNVVDPVKCAKTYTMEGLRYFLLREGVAHSDGNFSHSKLLRILNSELADTLGNLLSRVCANTLNIRQIFPKLYATEYKKLAQLDVTKRLIEHLNELPGKCEQYYEEYNFYLVCDQVIAALHAGNNFFETCKPWELKKSTSQKNLEKLETIIGIAMHTLRISGIILQPIIPDITRKLLDKLNVPINDRNWKNLKFPELLESNMSKCNLNNEKQLDTKINSVLFQRIIINNNIEEKTIIKKNIKNL